MLTPMTHDQRRHLDEVDALWPRYAALAGSREDHSGGMQWKLVGGVEYLTRYRPDAQSGKKVARSLGRRSPETERQYDQFFKGRDAAKFELAQLAPRIEIAGRIGKAVRLIGQLDASLNMEKGGQIAANLHNLYLYMLGRLTTANAHNDAQIVAEVANLVRKIKSGWDQIVKDAR